MTEVVRGGTEWVPPFGLVDLPADRAALIRGLFELAAFVADHPELPLPSVEANVHPVVGADYVAKVDFVDEVAAALGVMAGFSGGAHYRAVRRSGSLVVKSVAISDEQSAANRALMSYWDNIRLDEAVQAGDVG